MKYENEYSYETLILHSERGENVRVVKKTFFGKAENYLRGQGLSRDIVSARRTALRLLARYLEDKSEFKMGNCFLLNYFNWYKSLDTSQLKMHAHERSTGSIRELYIELSLRGYFKVIELFPIRTIQKIQRLSKLSKLTRTCLIDYEQRAFGIKTQLVHYKNGSELVEKKVYSKTNRRLTGRTIECRIGRFLTLLKKLNVTCISEVSFQNLNELLVDEGLSDSIRKNFLEVESLFANVALNGLIKINPMEKLSFEKPRSKVNNDMLLQTDIERIKELALHLEQMDKIEARTLVFMLLSYDTAMRINETLLLDCNDLIFEDDGSVTVLLKGDNQKGKDNIDRYLVLYFPEAVFAVKAYVEKIRSRFSPKCQALFVGADGERLKDNQMNTRIKVFCRKMEIKTFKGKEPSSHIFRHSFASHNIEPLGLKLNLDQIISRLRHKDRSLAEKVYILDNPFMEKLKHKERLVSQNIGTHERFWMIPKKILLNWLKSELKLEISIIEAVELAYETQLSLRNMNKQDKVRLLELLDEDVALSLLSHFNLTKAGLRKYSIENGYATEFMGNYKYDEAFIWMLRNEFETKEEALNKLKVNKSSLYRLKKQLGLISIGRVGLVHKPAVLEYLSS